MTDGKVGLVLGLLSEGIKVGVERSVNLVGGVGYSVDGVARAEGWCEGSHPLVVVGVRGTDDRRWMTGVDACSKKN